MAYKTFRYYITTLTGVKVGVGGGVREGGIPLSQKKVEIKSCANVFFFGLFANEFIL